MGRRALLKGTLASGAVLLSGPARAQSLTDFTSDFDKTFGPHAVPAPVPAQVSDLSAYQRRIAAVALRELERSGDVPWHRDRVAIADFAQPSGLPRLHFVEIEGGRVDSYLVAHGKGSDREGDGWLKSFSNVMGSEATSRGAYLTGSWYNGKYGTSIRLRGLDADNSNAEPRNIVMHPAWYAAPDMLSKWGKLGRSEGCFAMAPDQFDMALLRLAGGRLIYADRIGEG